MVCFWDECVQVPDVQVTVGLIDAQVEPLARDPNASVGLLQVPNFVLLTVLNFFRRDFLFLGQVF